MDNGAVDITERSEKGKNMQLLRVPLCLRLLVLTCWTISHGVYGACTDDTDCLHGGTCTTGTPSTCDCADTGYNGDTCDDDINECTATDATKHNCHEHADCTNTLGSFTCSCKSGYAGDGTTCTEGVCSEGGKECASGGTCDTSSTPTTCKCADGYTGDTCQNAGGTMKISAYLMALTVLTFFVIL